MEGRGKLCPVVPLLYFDMSSGTEQSQFFRLVCQVPVPCEAFVSLLLFFDRVDIALLA